MSRSWSTERARPRSEPREGLPRESGDRVRDVADAFRASWESGGRPRIEDSVEELPEPEHSALLRTLLEFMVEKGGLRRDPEALAAYLARFPDDGQVVRDVVDGTEMGSRSAEESPAVTAPIEGTTPLWVPDALRDTERAKDDSGGWIESGLVDDRSTASATVGPQEGATEENGDEAPAWTMPERVGRYEVRRLVGEGGFGKVFEGWDAVLERPVALKVPRDGAFDDERQAESFVREARLAAALDHPSIVRVHDVGRDERGMPFVVLQYIEGMSLSDLMRAERVDHRRLAGIVATTAEALAYAHAMGVVHRDLKPANLLVDAKGMPHIADFGLALHEGKAGPASEFAGTTRYMAPEQVRGESHRLDGRTDLWGVGVVMYRMLTGRLPFDGGKKQVYQAILRQEPRAPRDYDASIPRELERICLKCLSKRMRERYAGAKELADDLRMWLAPPETEHVSKASWDRADVKVVPKGLRAFEGSDATFFPALLPGPHDRDGMPEGLRFWKSRVDSLEGGDAFAVGLLYGPSGAGKTSFLRAGLVPVLGAHLRPVYLEAVTDGLEDRLIRALRKACPDLPGELSAVEAVLAIREGPALRGGKKLLLVIDQFERWLQGKAPAEAEAGVLVEMLRQCDGVGVQCLLAVRDDFGMAALRFMNAVEVPVAEGKNYGALPRFDASHAARVLGLFGRAHQKVPAEGEMSADQRKFLEQAAASLTSEDGHVAPVRLALFERCFRNKAWGTSTLKRFGGAEGIGLQFLEESLGSGTVGDPRRTAHREAAKKVLEALLPPVEVGIKGHETTRETLLAASRYPEGERAFDDLMGLLEEELRLVTRVETGYRLTQDDLVPSIRRWLAMQEAVSARGRARLLLEERTALWASRPEPRYLPSFPEWLKFAALTKGSERTEAQGRMMRGANRYYVKRVAAAAVVGGMVLSGAASMEAWVRKDRRERESRGLVRQLLVAETGHVRESLDRLTPYRASWWETLRRVAADPKEAAGVRMRAHLALVREEPTSVPFLVDWLLKANPEEHALIRRALGRWPRETEARLWKVMGESGWSPGRLVRGASALSEIMPGDRRWEDVSNDLARGVTTEPLPFVPMWIEALRPVGSSLVGAFEGIYGNPSRRVAERLVAAMALRRFKGDDHGLELMVDLLKEESSSEDFAMIFANVAGDDRRVSALLRDELSKGWAGSADERERQAGRKANAAIALRRLGEKTAIWPGLSASESPALRDRLIHRLRMYGIEDSELLGRLQVEADPKVKQAILLALGEPAEVEKGETGDAAKRSLVEKIFAEDDDPGVHAAAEWLLRRWAGREEVAAIRSGLRSKAGGGWWVTPEGFTMVRVAKGPVQVAMGSPEGTNPKYRTKLETVQVREVKHGFAISAHEVTVAQFRRYKANFPYDSEVCPDDDGPMTMVSWYEAAKFCRRLSEKEGVSEDQMCYPPIDQIKDGVTLPRDGLERSGYRLPTEAEWEYSVRAGTTTTWFFGEGPGSLKRYAWMKGNSELRVWPGGLLKPNPAGLFDVYGNAYEWCHDAFVADESGDDVVRDALPRAARGEGYRASEREARSAFRDHWEPPTKYSPFGFRLCRTLKN